MKKLILPVLLLALLLSACGASQNSATSANNTNAANGTLPPLTSVALGIFKLEGTDQAITPQQASDLLPLWEVYSSLSQSGTAAQAEVDALAQQIQGSMTADQLKAIEDMKLTPQDLFALLEEKGLTAGMPSAGGTRTPYNNGSGPVAGGPGGGPGGFMAGGPLEGSGMPGGGIVNPTGTQTANSQNTPQARAMGRIPAPLLQSLISLLEERANS